MHSCRLWLKLDCPDAVGWLHRDVELPVPPVPGKTLLGGLFGPAPIRYGEGRCAFNSEYILDVVWDVPAWRWVVNLPEHVACHPWDRVVPRLYADWTVCGGGPSRKEPAGPAPPPARDPATPIGDTVSAEGTAAGAATRGASRRRPSAGPPAATDGRRDPPGTQPDRGGPRIP